MNGLPNVQFPRWVRWQFATVDWLIEHPRVALIGTFIALLLLVFSCVEVVQASCGTIYERMDLLCSQLGYDKAPCPIVWETDDQGRYLGGYGQLMLMSDWTVDEPLIGGGSIQFIATAVRFWTPKGAVSKIFGVTNPEYWAENTDFDRSLGDAPYITPKGTTLGSVYGPDVYLPVGPWELLDSWNIGYRMTWQRTDPRIERRLQKMYGAKGYPVAVYANERKLAEGASDGLANDLVMDVVWGFALPKE